MVVHSTKLRGEDGGGGGSDARGQGADTWTRRLDRTLRSKGSTNTSAWIFRLLVPTASPFEIRIVYVDMLLLEHSRRLLPRFSLICPCIVDSAQV